VKHLLHSSVRQGSTALGNKPIQVRYQFIRSQLVEEGTVLGWNRRMLLPENGTRHHLRLSGMLR